MRSSWGTLIGLALSALVLSVLPVTESGASRAPALPIKVRVVVARPRAIAGQPIKGSVVLTNTSSRDITIDTCAVNGWLAVGLSGRVDSYPFARTLVGCAPTLRLAPGANRFPVTIITTYATCTQPQPAAAPLPTRQMPTCAVTGPPPLPSGGYFTKIDIAGLDGLTRAPNRIAVHLTAPKDPPQPAPCAEKPGTAPALVMVPNVVGAHVLAAASTFAALCLNADYSDPVGKTVTAETPVAGSEVAAHSTVELTTH
jgi:hypothetical protein